MADELDSDFAANERIFHYTNSAGLFLILGSNCLWATHFRFLNDRQEFYSARSSLVDSVRYELLKIMASFKVNKRLKGGVKIRELATHEAETIIDAMYTATMNLAWWFVFSGFVSAPGHPDYNNVGLLHWATYGRGGGYALRLNPHKLNALFKNESEKFECSCRSSRVFYVGQKPPKLLNAAYEIIGDVAREVLIKHVDGDLDNADVTRSLGPFERLISFLKDPYFANENEARIALTYPRDAREKPKHTVHVRHRGTTAIPYIKIFQETLLGDGCPIDAVIVGPHADQARRKDAAAVMIESLGLKDVEILCSNVPFVSD
jgi:hypothetical protein